MSSNPLVSVIIIFLNAEKFIQEAIDSAFTQTYENWELFLVDDGSTDASTQIALKYAERYHEKVNYMEHDGHQNKGMSASRNLGISKSRGKYIAFLDADDVWLPQKLKQQVAIMESNPKAAMVYGPSLFWYSWTGNPGDLYRDYEEELDVEKNTLIKPPRYLTLFLQNENFAPSTSALIRSKVIECTGGFEEVFKGMYEDQAFFAKLCFHEPVFVVNEYWFKYRRHKDACCHEMMKNGQHSTARLNFLNWIEKYLQKQGSREDELWTVLQKELWPYRHSILHNLLERFRHRTKYVKRKYVRGCNALWTFKRFRILYRLTPIRRVYGYGRGQCIDRYYIEKFLERYAKDIYGHVLEIEDNAYTHRFGGERVLQSDVLDLSPDNSQATIIADLTNAANIPSETFDCIILTQTLQYVYDLHAAIQTLYRILKPGGVLLATIPGIAQSTRNERENMNYCWRFTVNVANKLFTEVFGEDYVTIQAYGNVFASVAFLHGLVVEEVREEELDYHDPDYEMLVTIRAKKQEGMPS